MQSLVEPNPDSQHDMTWLFAIPFTIFGIIREHFTSSASIITLLGIGLLSFAIGGIGVRILFKRFRARQSFLGVTLATIVALLPMLISWSLSFRFFFPEITLR